MPSNKKLMLHRANPHLMELFWTSHCSHLGWKPEVPSEPASKYMWRLPLHAWPSAARPFLLEELRGLVRGGSLRFKGSCEWRLNQVRPSQLPGDKKNSFNSDSSLKNHKADKTKKLQPFFIKSSNSKVLI